MGDISEFKRGQIVGAHLAGTSVTRTASLCGVSRATGSRVRSAYHLEGQTTSNRSNCRCKRKLSERDVQVLTRIESKNQNHSCPSHCRIKCAPRLSYFHQNCSSGAPQGPYSWSGFCSRTFGHLPIANVGFNGASSAHLGLWTM